MATDYERIYRESAHALGAPSEQFVDFFRSFEKPNARVLDIGCGQGRDALFIARLGHHVTAVDLASAGIRQLCEDAAKEDLDIQAIVADIRDVVPTRHYDVIVIDRTLHMLPRNDQLTVLRGLLPFTADGAAVLIADEKSNIASFEREFGKSQQVWTPILKNRGLLFFRRGH